MEHETRHQEVNPSAIPQGDQAGWHWGHAPTGHEQHVQGPEHASSQAGVLGVDLTGTGKDHVKVTLQQ